MVEGKVLALEVDWRGSVAIPVVLQNIVTQLCGLSHCKLPWTHQVEVSGRFLDNPVAIIVKSINFVLSELVFVRDGIKPMSLDQS